MLGYYLYRICLVLYALFQFQINAAAELTLRTYPNEPRRILGWLSIDIILAQYEGVLPVLAVPIMCNEIELTAQAVADRSA